MASEGDARGHRGDGVARARERRDGGLPAVHGAVGARVPRAAPRRARARRAHPAREGGVGGRARGPRGAVRPGEARAPRGGRLAPGAQISASPTPLRRTATSTCSPSRPRAAWAAWSTSLPRSRRTRWRRSRACARFGLDLVDPLREKPERFDVEVDDGGIRAASEVRATERVTLRVDRFAQLYFRAASAVELYSEGAMEGSFASAMALDRALQGPAMFCGFKNAF
ncbi:MAG: sterol carrier protein domain-containing protein [Polyangiales bacterium]